MYNVEVHFPRSVTLEEEEKWKVENGECARREADSAFQPWLCGKLERRTYESQKSPFQIAVIPGDRCQQTS